ncbi:response regulator transcription factor [Microbacterium sp. NPDC077391]|uniref:response regulator transcription factor n=1 Tax=unclassified Microbacterium TaxID=2609290 RepID=UPI0008FCBED8|nr:response regulator transcription factor [Microbacterium sp. AR7-10]OIU87366.1 DNA-binding response regulator [Microbacterium sp. AR7-10]
MLRVFLVDDHEVVRRGVAELLASQPDMELVGEAATCREALGRVAATLPDVAVLDVQLPDGNGAELCREIRQRHPRVRCLMFTAFDDDDAVFASILADASGYLLKSAHGVDLVHAIQRIAAGHRLINPVAAQRAAQQMRAMAADDPRFGSLGLRERQILALIADGLTNRLIADRLGLAEKTVKNYVSTMLAKLGLEHRTQAALFENDRKHAQMDAQIAGRSVPHP